MACTDSAQQSLGSSALSARRSAGALHEAGAGKLTASPEACTPASVRPAAWATVRRAKRRSSTRSNSTWTERPAGWRCHPTNPEPSKCSAARNVRLIGPESSRPRTPRQAAQILVPFDKSPTLRVRSTVTQDSPLQQALQVLAGGGSLSAEAAAAAFAALMRGEATPAQTAALLMGLRTKGETAEEVAGAALALRQAMLRVETERPERLVDTCGTGGGRVSTLNLSTAAAFVVAGAGVAVAKHGNRSYTSRSGSADVLEALGVAIELAAETAAAVLREAGLVFMFAPAM